MVKTELQALALLTGVPHALYKGVVYMKVEGKELGSECTGCFFTSSLGHPGSSECQKFRTPELTLYGAPNHYRMCDYSELRFKRPIWVKAAYD